MKDERFLDEKNEIWDWQIFFVYNWLPSKLNPVRSHDLPDRGASVVLQTDSLAWLTSVSQSDRNVTSSIDVPDDFFWPSASGNVQLQNSIVDGSAQCWKKSHGMMHVQVIFAYLTSTLQLCYLFTVMLLMFLT